MEKGCRKDDVVIDRLDQRFTDFLERYERDYNETKQWRDEHSVIIKNHADFIDEFKPIYRRVVVALGLICLSSLGILVKRFWGHIDWH